jgi:hypothetical protein
MDGQTDSWLDKETDGEMDRWRDGQRDVQMDGQIRQLARRRNRWTDGEMDRWTNVQRDRVLCNKRPCLKIQNVLPIFFSFFAAKKTSAKH